MPIRNELAQLNFECNYCGRLFRLKWQLSEHVRRHENKTPFKCNLCPKAFVKNSDLQLHSKCHSEDKSYKCKHCDKTFKTKQGKYFHEDVHGFNSFQCLKCKEVFKSRHKLILHKRTHIKTTEISSQSNSNYECSYCSAFFSTLEYKMNHEKEFHKKRKELHDTGLGPSIVGHAYDTLQSKKSPIVELENFSFPPYSCSSCQQTFTESANFLNHLKVEHPGKKLSNQQCNLCQKSISLNYFRHHIMSHYNIKPFACKVCDSKFVRDHDLQQHMTGHSNLKPFECLECNKKFQSNKHLNAHNRNSHSKTAYLCTICGKSFTKKPSLERHVKFVHFKSENKETCNKCGMEIFSYRMKQHTKKYHDKEAKVCEVCGITFNNFWNFKKHLKICTKVSEKSNFKTLGESVSVNIVEVLPCPHCSFISKCRTSLKRHCLEHHVTEVIKCVECPKVCLCKTSYEVHLKEHKRSATACNSYGKAQYECCFCGFISLYYDILAEHLRKHEYFKWILSWNGTNLFIDGLQLFRKAFENKDILSSSSEVLPIENLQRNAFSISVTKEISWNHDNFDHWKKKHKFALSRNSWKPPLTHKLPKTPEVSKLNRNIVMSEHIKKEIPLSCDLEIQGFGSSFTPENNQSSLLTNKPILSNNLETKPNFILHNKLDCAKPFILVEDLKKLNVSEIKALLKNF